MIRLRLKAFSNEKEDIQLPYLDKEILSDTVSRTLKENSLEGKEEHFQVLVNGHLVEKDFWETVQVKESDSVLIAPIISSGSFGQIAKIAITVVVAAAVASVTGDPTSAYYLGSTMSALAVAGATIGTSLVLNALIPPPVPGGFDIGGIGSSFEKSQMYTISSQGNSTDKFGFVPKVYGRHKIFPKIASNPYTEIETDPTTGDLVQYFYGVYDFGLGPLMIDEIKLGDTPISNYSDVTYNLVDFNRPDVSEGIWDDSLSKELILYKGDSETDNSSVILNENQVSGGDLSGYQVIRNSAPNPTNATQEITITFLNPQGLIAYAPNGDTSERAIDVDIEFSKVGEDNWKDFKDLNVVRDFKIVGGGSSGIEVDIGLLPFNETDYTNLGVPPGITAVVNERVFILNSYRESHSEYWGFPSTQDYIIASTLFGVGIGDIIFQNGKRLGEIASIAPHSAGYLKYTFTGPMGNNVYLYTLFVSKEWDINGDLISDTYTSGTSPEWAIKVKPRARFTIVRRETGPVYSTVKFTPYENAQFKIRITRVRSYSTGTYSFQDSLAVASIVTRMNVAPIITNKRHLFLELRIKATNQLNGNIQNLSAVATSVLDVWDGTSWSKQITNNPAWVYADLLTGEVNKRAIPKTRLDTASLLEWSEFCEEIPTAPAGTFFNTPRFTCNFILDFSTTLQTLLNQVANASQASLNIINGKYGVLIDKRKTIPVQIFTPRNSSGFSSTRNYSQRPNALKIRYIDPASSWDISEKIVYDDGFDATTATTFEDASTFACTNPDQAWRFGRYLIAQNKLRQEVININVDFEYLVCTRGDFVQITQDVMKVGGTPARVKAVSGTTITIDEGIETLPVSYGYVCRTSSGIVTNTLTVLSSDEFDVDGPIPSVGDLIVIGEVGQIVFDCLVKSITPNDELTASLVLVEKADAIYDAESTSTIPDYSANISGTSDTEFLPPREVTDLAVIENSWTCGANSFEHYLTIDWDVPTGTAFEFFEIFVDSGRGYNNVSTTRESTYTYFVDSTRVGFPHSFKVIAVSATGKKLDLASVGSVSATPLRKTSNPNNVLDLTTNITGEVLQLDWKANTDCISEYLIRYTPSLTGTWVSSIPLMRIGKNSTSASTQARVGTYLIKAIDFNGNESLSATVAITTIPELFNLNVISSVTDFPTLTGSKFQTVKSGNTLMIKNKVVGGVDTNEYYTEGYYYYDNFLDLGEIYTVRLQSLIQAEGYTADDIIANWVTLSSVVAMSNSKFSEWDVETQYRGTESFNVMADWVTLASIDPISEGSQDTWTAWKKFTITDATFRIGQFRLRLISNKASVTPRVFDGTIKADMPDRLESYNDLVATTSGYQVVYTPSFKGPSTTPNIQITLENGVSGDYWNFGYKTLDGFEILFYDKDNNPVNRTFDASVKGFGRKAINVI